MNDRQHFSQKPRRNAEFIKPPNMLKTKVGSGGLSDDILNKAENLLENNTVDFQPLAEMYLAGLMKGIDLAKESDPNDDQEYVISRMLYPGMQLKANGGMFHYPLVTRIADKLIQFLEVIERVDIEVVEIVMAFHTTIRAVVMGRVSGDGGKHGTELMRALNEACVRYFDKYQGKSL
ncbi:MAG TPA: hypothetical protein PKX38_08955 [Alphaproteobacteria bacterium]|jgi:hypothetical protein|nr:hypothetical protein [Micavibrio sp.]MBK9563045.1 hypothetical protein [Micavibrio sp.]HQX28047.1 hypothetical protein [Alphaproteobacteria bacterium]